MGQIVDPELVVLVNSREYEALQAMRRNSANDAYEWARPVWPDSTNTFTGFNVFVEAPTYRTGLTLEYGNADPGSTITVQKDGGPFTVTKATLVFDDATDTLAIGGVCAVIAAATGGTTRITLTTSALTLTVPQTITIPGTEDTVHTALTIRRATDSMVLCSITELYDPDGSSGYVRLNFFNNKTGGASGSIGFVDGFAGISFDVAIATTGTLRTEGGLTVGNLSDSMFSGRIVSYASQHLVLQAQSGFETRVQASSAANIPLVAKGAASQTADLQQWQDSAGNIAAKMDKDGLLTVSKINLTTESASGALAFINGGTPILPLGSSADDIINVLETFGLITTV